MQKLIDTIKAEGRYLGNSILKVDSFLNHQVDSELMTEIGKQLFKRLSDTANTDKPTGNCRMIYARKSMSKTMVDDFYTAKAVSRTRGNDVTFYVNSKFLLPDDNVLIIEDFLATGSSIAALTDIVYQSGANLIGVGAVIEKPAENGRAVIGKALQHNCPIASLACIDFEDDELITSLGCLDNQSINN